MTLRDWAPLNFVDSALLSQVRLAYVFGRTGHEVFIVTKNDEVYAWGPNYSECLGLGKVGPQIQPVRIPELCNKNVIGFSSFLNNEKAFVCAYTDDKTYYMWGKYLEYLVKSCSTPTCNLKLIESLKSIKVLKIVCGPDHGLILSSDEQVFSFGHNSHGQLGRRGKISQIPTLIQGDLIGKNVTKVSCGAYFSVAVLNNGEVFAWGHNFNGELGVGNEYGDSSSPIKVSALSNVRVTNIVCGESYVVAVSDVGELYLWGKNDVGQLGLGDTTSRFKPVKMEQIGKIVDIAATCYGSTTAVMNENNEVYMWGACGGMNITEPTKTPFDTVFGVFAFMANPRIMPRPMSWTFESESVGESIKNAFGDSGTSDLTIVADGKEIFVHKTILMLRSEYFKVRLQEPWLKEDTKVMKIDQNYDGLHAYLQYLYTGKFEGSPKVALETLQIASEYDDILLKEICESHAIREISVDNVAELYNLAVKLDMQVFAKHCVLFAGKHVKELIDSRGFTQWDINIYKQFIKDCYVHKVQFKY